MDAQSRMNVFDAQNVHVVICAVSSEGKAQTSIFRIFITWFRFWSFSCHLQAWSPEIVRFPANDAVGFLASCSIVSRMELAAGSAPTRTKVSCSS
ncbi:hypothetical protein [Novipirellula aureliae]|uniref:hypothetical protein n=1 Tax=Novipirellula aureliae TaxID=2527966 RepID=UPI0011B63DF4|nr:hypothetical protein [Novipirellula aureliae]